MIKPEWRDAPEWANWLAMDRDGTWYWYESEPVFGGSMWQCKGNGRSERADTQEYFTPAGSLESRPMDKPFREIVPTHEDASATDVVTRWTHGQTAHFDEGLQKLLDEE